VAVGTLLGGPVEAHSAIYAARMLPSMPLASEWCWLDLCPEMIWEKLRQDLRANRLRKDSV
jgi:hypothetical protein